MDSMNLVKSFREIVDFFNSEKIGYALIGGWALSVYVNARATYDIDFLVDGNCKDDVKRILKRHSFDIFFESNEVLQLSGVVNVDILYANRPLTREMLKNAQNDPSNTFKVVLPEDLIGLKIQAMVNEPTRELQEKADISNILSNVETIDIEKVKQYADIFNVWDQIVSLKNGPKN